MTETPEPENGEQPQAPIEAQPNNLSESLASPTETNQTSVAAPEQLSDLHRPSSDEIDSEDRETLKPEQPNHEEAAHEHERLDQQGKFQAEINFKQQIEDNEEKRKFEVGKRNVSLIRLDKDIPHIRRVNRLFVEPEGYQEFVKHIMEYRILIVSGHEGSGRFATAVYLAQVLWRKKDLEVYRFVDRNKRTINDIIYDNQLPRNSVILFDNVFNTTEEQIKLDDLLDDYVNPDNDLAGLGNVWFIFTIPGGPIQEKLQDRGFPILSTHGVNCQQVVEKLLDFFCSLKDRFSGQERAELLAKLNPNLTPPDLYWLFSHNQGDSAALLKALTQEETLETKEPPPHIWFHALKPMNYQLYALLVVLFDKLDMPTLEEIYTSAVHVLRRQGMDGPDEFIDPRRIGTDLMHMALGIQVSFNTVLEFRSRLYRQYVENQIENFQRLLWSLIDPDDPSTSTGLIGLLHRLSEAEENQPYTDSTDQVRQLRAAIAIMIAQVGIYHLPRLGLLLDKLVSDESALVALTVAQVLAEIARRGTHFEFIEKLLNTWCDNGRFDQKWAAVASISYIYDAIARTLEAVSAPPIEEDEMEEGEGEETQNTKNQDHKQHRKEYLIRLRDMLRKLAETYDFFSEQSINLAKLNIYIIYRERIRQLKLADSKPITDEEHLFRDLSEQQQIQYITIKYKNSIDDAVQRDIELLINSWKNQMCLILVQTLGYLVQMWPRDITRLVHVWVDRKDTQSQLWQIGHMALNYLFWASTRIKDAPLLERSAYPLLDLIPLAIRPPVLTMGTFLHDMQLALQIEEMSNSGTLEEHLKVGALQRADPLISALDAIQKWYEKLSPSSKQQENTGEHQLSEEDEEDEIPDSSANNALHQRWQQKVYTVLSNTMNSADQQERQRLRRVLFLWTKSEYPMLNRIAHILIAHSYAMDGGVLDLPSSNRAGLIVIDSNRSQSDDREIICYFVQSLSAIAPLHVHWLGDTRHNRFLSSDNRDEEGKADGRTSFGPDDLLRREARRPGLLLPILTPDQGKGYTPEQTYFVAVFHTEQILDLADLYQNAPTSLLDRKHYEPIHPVPLSQPWQDKVYLLPSTAELTAPASLAALLTVVEPDNLGLLEEDLRKRITLTLRACPTAELWRELQTYIGTSEAQHPTIERLTNDIERWLQQLADTSVLYPDVSLFILWTIMIRSRENLSEAIQLIRYMLQEQAEEREDKATRRVRKLRQKMGIACTRMLFHFYGVDNPTLAPDPYSSLLDLLPQIAGIVNSYTEILPILSVLFQLANAPGWLPILNEDEGELFECLNKIPVKDIDALRNWLKYDQLLITMSRLFIEFNRPYNDFLAKSEEVQHRFKTAQDEQPTRGEVVTPNDIDSKFLAILPSGESEKEQTPYRWALQQIKFAQARLRDPGSRFTTLAGLKNLEMLLNHLVNRCQNRLNGTIERLKQGEYYGIVMVESQNKTVAHQTFLLLQEFAKQRRSNAPHTTLMLQRLGEKGVLTKVRNNSKIRSEREIRDKRDLPLVMGPLLERYPAEQVAFVLLITTAPITDYDDWAEQEQWASRLWVARLGKWCPYRGEIVALKESMSLTLETILQRSGGGIGIL